MSPRVVVYGMLLTVSAWAALEHAQRRSAFAWTRPLRVRVVPLLAPGLDVESVGHLVDRFLSLREPERGTLGELASWFAAERQRHAPDRPGSVEWRVATTHPTTRAPPYVPDADEGLLARWAATREFLAYFRDAAPSPEDDSDVDLFVYFYDAREREKHSGRSAGSDSTRQGVAFVPLDEATFPYYQILLAHELCHALGASDKYDSRGSKFPGGYAEPQLSPLHPQRHAEIMALSVPRAPGREAQALELGQCVLGDATARELGW